LTVTYSGGLTTSYTLAGQPSGTAVVLHSDGSNGTDLTLTPLPTATPDRASATVGTTINTDVAHGVLANNTDPIPGDTLSVTAVNGQSANVGHAIAGTYGSLTLYADGHYTYSASSSAQLPASGLGQDVFTYTDTTGQGGTASSTLTVDVTAAPGRLHLH
jgi:VCBS repeat-containing protein